MTKNKAMHINQNQNLTSLKSWIGRWLIIEFRFFIKALSGQRRGCLELCFNCKIFRVRGYYILSKAMP
jgi:hypothetical protein